MDEQDPWICDSCGEVATGDLCMKCGNQAPLGPSSQPDPLAMKSILGMPLTPLAARMALLFWLAPALFLLFVTMSYFACSRP